MYQIPAEVFSLSNEAVVLLRGGKACFANRLAMNILGADCVGKSTKRLFGSIISNAQAPCFTAELYLDSRFYTACVSRFEQYQILFLHEQPSAADYVGDKFWISTRDGLMNLGLSLELWREHSSDIENPQLKKSVAAMTHSYYKMSRMVTNVSYVLDSDNCRIVPSPMVFDLSSLCRELVNIMQFLYPRLSFSLNCPDELHVYADRSMINTAILNLLSNSLTHAEGCTSISLSLAETNDSVIISVSDDGCGIEPDMMHSVFSHYKDKLSLTSTGAGFGLTVVRSIARSFGGTLLLESRSGHGTAVRMSISRHIPSGLHSSGTDYSQGMRHVLEGLADCLPSEAFENKYMD